jgi:hypothetical protein
MIRNIDTHVKTQHAVKWAEFEEAKIAWGGLACQTWLQECDKFFLQNHYKRSSSVMGHFPQGSGSYFYNATSKKTSLSSRKELLTTLLVACFIVLHKYFWLEVM